MQQLIGNSANLTESQKNLLPEVYVNSKFFQSIFGGNTIDIVPQGSVGIDLGALFKKMTIQLLHHETEEVLVLILIKEFS